MKISKAVKDKTKGVKAVYISETTVEPINFKSADEAAGFLMRISRNYTDLEYFGNWCLNLKSRFNKNKKSDPKAEKYVIIFEDSAVFSKAFLTPEEILGWFSNTMRLLTQQLRHILIDIYTSYANVEKGVKAEVKVDEEAATDEHKRSTKQD